MRIRRKYTTQEIGASYQYWRDNILSKHLEENYEILSHPDIVDVFETNTSNGAKIYIDTIDSYLAIQQYVEKSDIYSIRPTTAIFDKFYRMKTKPTEVFVLDVINAINNLSKPNIKPHEKNEKQILNLNNNMKKLSKIFISHSSADKKYVAEIIELLGIIGIKNSEIFCSSFEGFGIGIGENFLETLKQELNNDVLVIFVLSNNFYKSPICLCEMGATWIKTNIHIPVLIPPFNYNKIKGVIQNTQGLKLNESLQLNLLKEKLEQSFDLTPQNSTIWESKRNRILNRINELIEMEKPKARNSLIQKATSKNALLMISAYAKDNKLTAISFETISKIINSKFDENFVMDLVEQYPLDIRRTLLKNGKYGIKLL